MPIKTTYDYLIRNLKKLKIIYFRYNLARSYKDISEQNFLKAITGRKFQKAINLLDKTTFTKSEANLAKSAFNIFSNGKTEESLKVRSMFICFLYFKSFQFPEDTLFATYSNLKPDYLPTAYTFLFNVYRPYIESGDANNYATFLRAALSWLAKDIKTSEVDVTAHKLELFNRRFSGSVSMNNTVNMKDIYVAQRELLKLLVAAQYPSLKEGLYQKPNGGQKIKIGLIRYNYTGEIHYFQPILKHLDRTKYEIHIIVFNGKESEKIKKLYPELIHHVVDQKIPEALAYIRGLNLDILINSTSLSGDFYNIIASILSYRAAPIQLVAFGDVTTSGIKNVDYFLMGETYITPFLNEELSEKILPAPGIGYYIPIPQKYNYDKNKTRAELKLKDNDILYVSNANLFKLVPELIMLWLSILKQVPNSKLLIMPFNSKAVKERFGHDFLKMLSDACESQNIQRSRIIVSNAQGPEQVIKALSSGDIYLDSYPYSGPTSATEALSIGLPVVTQKGKMYRNALVSGLLESLSLQNLIAVDEYKYKEIAVNLAKDAYLRDNTSKAILKKMETSPFFDSESIAKQYDGIFQELKASA